VPPGTWGEWVRTAGRVNGFEFQPVQVELPSTGRVTWFIGSRDEVREGDHVRLAVSQSYRVRLSDLPEFPGIELFPSIEVLDRLHPPAGQADSFPLPITFAIEEIDAAVQGQMITKVVYLEQPQLAAPFELTSDTAVRTVNARVNLIEEADKAGRPLALIRLGGRLPSSQETHGAFFGSGAPVLVGRVSHRSGNQGHENRDHTGSPLKSVAGQVENLPHANAVTFTEAEPRVQLTSHAAAQEANSEKTKPPLTVNPKLAELYPDEYLFDGGDQGYPVHYDREFMLGLESEDTIAEYHDENGNRRVKASNRVAIYAPRFAAVRSASGLREDFNVQRLASNFDQIQGAGLRHQVGGKTHLQRDRLQGVRMRSRANGLLGKATRAGVAGSKGLAQHTKLLNLFEDAQFIRDGEFRQSEIARLNAGLTAAVTWSRELNPVIVANLSAAQEVYATFKVAELAGSDQPHKHPGRLRIVKLADTDVAKPGDVITFTVRFDNLGDRELRNIRIIDNLTPRLNYVDDSATSDRDSSIDVDDNGEGSQILRFELDGPLTGHTGGVISFQAKLR
ncbi:MAG TPA: DUF11 domain-containing protein, partial [Planctomycetaceae bacterium]|nr:DUF11 domain-containing protein [Planctomycetaceae bacterium]